MTSISIKEEQEINVSMVNYVSSKSKVKLKWSRIDKVLCLEFCRY